MAASASRIANAGLYRSLTYRCLQKPSCASLYREAVPRPYKSSAVIVSATVRGFRSTASNMAPIERVHTEKAPIAGPYSQAIKTGNSLFVSGQIPMDASGNLIDGSIGDKTAACLANLKVILEAAGSSMDKVVKCNVFLTDASNFANMNAEYEKHFGEVKPARSCVIVAGLPKDVPVEIEAIAIVE